MAIRSIMVLALLMGKTTAFLPPNNSFSPSPTSLTERSNTRTSLSMTAQQSYNKVFLAGASRGVGNCLLKTLVAEGIHVVALVRSPEVLETLNAIEGVTAILGDAFDYKSVEGAMDGCDAAISTLGGSMSKGDGSGDDAPTKVDYTGNSNVIEAAGILGVTRLVLLTSIGCGTSKEAAPPAVFDVLAPTLKAKEKAENLLIKYYTNMNWTIIRPGGLKSEAATGKAVLSDDCLAIGSIHRQDCADLVAKALTSPKTERQVLSAIDPSIIAAVNPDARPITEFALS